MIYPPVAVEGRHPREITVAEPIGEHLDLRPPALRSRAIGATLESSLSDKFFEERDEIELGRRPLRKLGRGGRWAVVAAGGALQIAVGVRLGSNKMRKEAGDCDVVGCHIFVDQKFVGGLLEQPFAFRSASMP